MTHEIVVLVERVEAGYVATASDGVGVVASARSRVRDQAVAEARLETLRRLTGRARFIVRDLGGQS